MTGIQRITNAFAKNKAFVAYLTAGDGGMAKTLAAALALIEAGVTILEIGVPFSDPIADGPVIQRAAARSLDAGTTLSSILDLIKELRKHTDIPLILFTYLNPLLQALSNDFLNQARQAGIDGLLVVDCPLEEMDAIVDSCRQQGIAPIFVASPTTSVARLQMIAQQGQGFLYYACRKGTTGIRTDLPEDFTGKMQTLRTHVKLPIVVGFGIATRQAASQVLQYADGVVVGSLFVQALENDMQLADLQQLAKKVNPLVE